MGCDHRIFRRLQVEGFEFVPLPWVANSDDDTLITYAAKMAVNIKDANPILLGLSFGGMLAVEIAKQINVKQVILVSSAKTSNELPEPGKFARYLVKKRLIPAFCFSLPNRFLMGLRGIVPFSEQTKENGPTAISGKFMQWALKAVMDWHNGSFTENVTHIHGTMDIVIPLRNVKADYVIKGGVHVMVHNRADEVSNILSGILNTGM